MNDLMRSSKLFLKRHAPTILTCIGSAGVIATSVMAARATPKALLLLDRAKEEKGEDLTKIEVVQVAGPVYIPAVLVGASTIACIFGANILNKRQQAALASAYALLSSSYKEYKEKTKELYGKDADSRVREHIAQDHYQKHTSVEDGKQLFYDFFARRYFEATIEEVQQAEYCINHDLALYDRVSLNDFYRMLRLSPVKSGDELGWSKEYCRTCYGYSWIEFEHQKTVFDDGLECNILAMPCEPTTI